MFKWALFQYEDYTNTVVQSLRFFLSLQVSPRTCHPGVTHPLYPRHGTPLHPIIIERRSANVKLSLLHRMRNMDEFDLIDLTPKTGYTTTL